MKRTSSFLRIRSFAALALIGGSICLAKFSIAPPQLAKSEPTRREIDRLRTMPEPGGKADDFNQMEEEWFTRVTYPTGIFKSEWLRNAADVDALIPSAIPAGIPGVFLQGPRAPLALTSTGFTSLGPAPLRMTGCSLCFNYTTTEGRVNDIVVDPTTTTLGSIVAYLGSDGGGVWKTTNCCSAATTWTPVTDDPLLSTINIDTLTIDPHNHNVIYAGTGDLTFGTFSSGSQGILKSTDAGAHWTLLGANVFGPGLPQPAGQFPQYQAVGKVRVDPNNSNNVVAGTKTGLFFSYDGGNNWTGPCTTNNFSSQRQDITGLELSNINGITRIIAAVGVRGYATRVQYNLNQNGANGLYKGTMPASGCPGDFTPISTNANGWNGTNATSGVPCNLPIGDTTSNCAANTNQLGRIDIAVAPSNPNYIYAQVQSINPNQGNQTLNGALFAGCGGVHGCQLAAWRSTDGGNTWSQIQGSTGDSLADCGQFDGDYPQNWYDQGIAVDPNNPDRVFFDTFEIWFWQNGNTTWNDTTCGYDGIESPLPLHVDQHALAFVPGSSSILLAGSDGGVYSTINADQASSTVKPAWVNMDLGLNTIEFYSGDISANFATDLTPSANGGAQDNGSSSVTFSGSPTGPTQWQMGTGGDGFFARIDPVGASAGTPALRFFQGGNGGLINRCVQACTAGQAVWTEIDAGWGGDRRSGILPYEIFKGDLNNPANDCAAAGPNGGCGHMIAGTFRVWETINANTTNPLDVTWYANSPDLTKGTLADRSYINQLAFEPADQTKAAVGTNDGNVQIGFGLGSGSASATWVNVTGNNVILPNRPILDVAFDPTTTNAPKVYAAVGGFNANTPTTPGHVYQMTCTNNCTTFIWANKTGNLPDIPVDSIIANPKFTSQVFAGTDWGLYYTNDITAISPVWYRFDNGLPHAMVWDMQIDRGNTTLSVWTRSRGAYVWPLPSSPLLNLVNAVSRKTHGSAGIFDLDITSGSAIECRSGGANNDYTVIFTFTNSVTSCGVASTGTVTAGPNSNQCSVDINAPSGQHVTVQLTGVTDSNANIGTFSATMGVLVGDTNADTFVDAVDTSDTKSQSGKSVTSSNFREDVNADGFIDAVDVALVKSKSGTALSSSSSPNSSPTPVSKSSPAPKAKPRNLSRNM